ncbi:MAG: response regulator [Chitinispirillia bacterium]|jgi:DNA-binding NarL/FixJ family response regulator
MNRNKGKKKNILLLHSKESIQSSLSQILTEMDSNVISMGSCDVDKSMGNIKNIDFLIVDLELPESKAVTLIRQMKNTNPQIKIITMCNRITNPIYARMKTLGVSKILERPLKKSVFKEAVESVFMGKDSLKMLDNTQQITSESSEHFYILVASADSTFYQKIYEISFSEGYEVYLSMNEGDFISKIHTGFYNVIFSSYNFMERIISTHDINSLFLDGVKPALILLDDIVDKTGSNSFSSFPVVIMLPQRPTKEDIINSLHDSIPKIDKYKDKAVQTGSHIYIEEKKTLIAKASLSTKIIDFFKKSFLLFYIGIIFVIAIIGFLISTMVETKDETLSDTPKSKQQEMIDQLTPEQIEKLKKTYKKSRENR